MLQLTMQSTLICYMTLYHTGILTLSCLCVK